MKEIKIEAKDARQFRAAALEIVRREAEGDEPDRKSVV